MTNKVLTVDLINDRECQWLVKTNEQSIKSGIFHFSDQKPLMEEVMSFAYTIKDVVFKPDNFIIIKPKEQIKKNVWALVCGAISNTVLPSRIKI